MRSVARDSSTTGTTSGDRAKYLPRASAPQLLSNTKMKGKVVKKMHEFPKLKSEDRTE